MMHSILIIEDNRRESEELQDILRCDDYQVSAASNGREGLRLAHEQNPDLIILDSELPDIDGDQICKTLRQQNHPPLIFMLTGARTEDIDEMRALRLRADEYMRKPYSAGVLVERVEKLLRQREGKFVLPDALEFENVTVDFLAYDARRGDTPVKMSVKELDVLRLLVSRAGTVVDREEFRDQLWPPGARVNRVLDNTIVSIRRELGLGDQRLRTVSGRGYAFARSHDVFVTIRGKKLSLADI
jgi:two-component system OmpR family response regulator